MSEEEYVIQLEDGELDLQLEEDEKTIQLLGDIYIVEAASDEDAIHDNVANEIHQVAEKASPAGTDEVIIEDSAASYAKKRVQLTNLPGGSGEANDGQNVGTAGVGIYKDKSGIYIRLKKINAGSSKISVTDDIANDEVDIDVVNNQVDHNALLNYVANRHKLESEMDLANLGTKSHTSLTDKGTNTHAQIDTHIGDGTKHFLESAINLASINEKSHTSLTDKGTNTHAQIDSHIAAANPHSGSLGNVVEDTTPQLGGHLDLNSKAFTEELTAAESLVNGNICYMNSAGKMAKADADAEATCDTLLAMCTETIAADATGTFILFGRYTTSGLTAGAEYFVSTTAGAITTTRPTATGDIVRHVGTALSTTVLFFNPSHTYIEIT